MKSWITNLYTRCSTNILGGVHHAPLYYKPRELPPLKPVAVEPLGEEGILRASPSAETPGGSLCDLIATTYSYVVIPYYSVLLLKDVKFSE